MNTKTAERELQRIFKNVPSAFGNSWFETLLDHSRRLSEPLAARMLSQMGLGKATSKPFKLFDNACGSGPVPSELHRLIPPAVLAQSSILCGDFSEQMVQMVQKRAESEAWTNVEAKVIDAQNNGLATASFTHVATNIGFHCVPDSKAALDEAIRILEPGGILGFTTWNREPSWAAELDGAFETFPFQVPPRESTLQATGWGDWGDVNWVREALVERGLEDVRVEVFAQLSRVDSVEHFISSFTMSLNWIMSSVWSEQLRNEHGQEEVHGLIKKYLERKYQGRPWELTWVSIVATGRVAGQ
ncbi:S-adenosyl-L-methionine-dependent methyltransferase [Lasiosphaeria miniovina]|uniref:S-adenosyl-L-methionine-dependent methyltransferase n=1 Tax=Lasiosphaeria miniovina TaxID=1954250 RepID=A0AA40ATD3_9PEZI|nr:S-adenosyl-L-methionine-dependent methyltransferase [Lasiosphaeria miniovina]KAK0721617.1 S-adenosyl-L-methionine-dependent methyltransferase [Lasiosphaeria miniovina]